jgi:HD-GYP domain-containing protein (c-di-GMP phosphodiesterase class II)
LAAFDCAVFSLHLQFSCSVYHQKATRSGEKLEQTLEILKQAVGTTMQVLGYALESRAPYTTSHQSQSANLACAIATEMGLDQDKIEGIHRAGIIHDIDVVVDACLKLFREKGYQLV